MNSLRQGEVVPSDGPVHFSMTDVERRLAEWDIDCARLELDSGWFILVSRRGGRVYGPFSSADSAPFNWMPQAFADEAPFAALMRSGAWNLGGERVWVGPEIRYAIRDRADLWGSYDLSAAMDPGVHRLRRLDAQVALTSEFTLESFLSPKGFVDFSVVTTVCSVPDPLGKLRTGSSRLATVEFGGYSVTVTLRQYSKAPIPSVSWNINQVNPGGVVLLPSAPDADITDYLEPSHPHVRRVSRGIEVEFSGSARFKIGTQAAQTFGRVGYISRAPQARVDSARESVVDYVLAVRAFPNDLTADYIEEPHHSPGHRGDSMHFYSDDGGLGGFGELEAHGYTIGKIGGPTESTDRFTTLWYRGSWDQLSEVSSQLLGLRPTDSHQRKAQRTGV